MIIWREILRERSRSSNFVWQKKRPESQRGREVQVQPKKSSIRSYRFNVIRSSKKWMKIMNWNAIYFIFFVIYTLITSSCAPLWCCFLLCIFFYSSIFLTLLSSTIIEPCDNVNELKWSINVVNNNINSLT